MTVEWRPPQQTPVYTPSPTESPPPVLSSRADFQYLLTALGDELDRGEALVERATRGGGAALGPGELIALQAGIYRYTEAVELTAKFVDRAQNALRTTLESGGR